MNSDLKQEWHATSVQKMIRRFRLVCQVLLVCGLLNYIQVLHAEEIGSEIELPTMMLDAIKLAMKTHPEVLKADSEMQSAKSQVKAGEYRWFPMAEVAIRTGESGDRYSTMGINQPLWDNGKRNADFAAAKAGASAAYSGKYLSMQSLGMAAVDAYLGLSKTREQLLVAQANVEEHQKLHASVLKRNAGGVSSKSDASLATSRLQQALAIEKQLRGEVAKAEAAYFSVIGSKAAAGDIQEIALWDLAGGSAGLVKRVLSRSPSLQKLKEELKAAEANVLSARAQLFPSLFARVDNTKYFGSGPFDSDTRFSLNFQWQNDVALTQRYRIEAAQYAVSATQQALAAEERILTQTAENFWADYAAAIERREELERFAKSAIETVSLFKRQFTIGRRSWPEVTNTLQDLYSAQNQKVEARYAAMISRMRIAFLAGEMDGYINSEIGGAGSSYGAEPYISTH